MSRATELAAFLAGLRSPRCGEAAAELRRMDAVNAELLAVLRTVAILKEQPMLADEVVDLARAAIAEAEAQQ